jgi:hypothetical protein
MFLELCGTSGRILHRNTRLPEQWLVHIDGCYGLKNRALKDPK